MALGGRLPAPTVSVRPASNLTAGDNPPFFLEPSTKA